MLVRSRVRIGLLRTWQSTAREARRYCILTCVVVCGLTSCATTSATGETTIKLYVQQKMFDHAIEYGSAALAADPPNADLHYFLGAAYFGKDVELDSSQDPLYASSSRLFLRRAFFHFMLAKELDESKWGSSADDNIVALFGRHYNRGVLATRHENHDRAAVEYELASIADPENYMGYYAHAAALWQLAREARNAGDADEFVRLAGEIIENLDKVLELAPDKRHVLVALEQTRQDVLATWADFLPASAALGSQEVTAPLGGHVWTQSAVPVAYHLMPATPNPFNPCVRIRFGIPKATVVRVSLYNARGRRVRVLADEKMSAGYHDLWLDAAGLASGVYYCHMQSHDFSAARKLTLMR